MRKFYQWLRRWGRLFEARTSGSSRRITHTEITVEHQGVTVLTGELAAVGLQVCPLCGQKLQPQPAEQTRLRLEQGSDLQGEITADGTSAGGQ